MYVFFRTRGLEKKQKKNMHYNTINDPVMRDHLFEETIWSFKTGSMALSIEHSRSVSL